MFPLSRKKKPPRGRHKDQVSKKIIFALLVLLLALGLSCLPGAKGPTLALVNYAGAEKINTGGARVEYQSPEKVPGDKAWTLLFNLPLDPATVTLDNVYVLDQQGKRVGVQLSTGEGGKAVLVQPLDPYLPGHSYTLYGEKGIRSRGGAHLTQAVSMAFTVQDQGLKIVEFIPARGEYYPGDAASSTLVLENKGDDGRGGDTFGDTFWVGCSLQDPGGEWHDVPAREIALPRGEAVTVGLSWAVPRDKPLTSGPYRVVMAAWDAPPGQEGARRLASAEKTAALEVFNYYDDFSTFNREHWVRSNHPLGLGHLRPRNVLVEGGYLKLALPANSYQGGQLETRQYYLYGSYRASLKLPQAPSTLTGFFLYREPDYYHEIDIEIVNDCSGKVWFTTYAGGKEPYSHSYQTYLGFDPTENFHEYRFDFYPGGVSFYVDGRLITSWSQGLTDTPMKLMVNAWFPQWLGKGQLSEDAFLLVDWIKH